MEIKELMLSQMLMVGGLTPSEANQIVHHTTNFDGLEERLVDNLASLKIHVHPGKFAKKVILKREGITHSQAGNNTLIEDGEWILGGGTFGLHSNLRHLKNGVLSESQVTHELPEFDAGVTQAALIRTIDEDSRNHSGSFCNVEYTLYVLLASE